MTNERDPDAGTPAADTDDSENAGTPKAEDDSDAGDGEQTPEQLREALKNERALRLSHQSKVEKVNALEEENRRLRAERESRATDNGGSEVRDQREKILAAENRIARLRIAAEGGNEEAQVMVDVLDRAIEADKRSLYRMEMMEIPADERREVEDFVRKNGGSPALARKFLNGGDKYETVKQENERLRRELEEAKKPKPKIEDTRVVGRSSAAAAKRSDGTLSITAAQYAEKMATPEGRKELYAARAENRLDVRAK